MEALRLPRSLEERVLAHALASPAVEVCGLLGGRDGAVTSWHPVPNVAADPARRFRMDPHGQIDAFRALREAGETLYAIVHSHPDAPAVPSQTDREELAYPEAVMIIVSLQKGAPGLRAWHWDGDGFRELEVVIE